MAWPLRLFRKAAAPDVQKAAVAPMGVQNASSLVPPDTTWRRVLEPFTGAWQRNISVENDRNLLAFSAVYACVTLIANDISKLRIRLMEQATQGVWEEVATNSPFLGVINKPNHYQNRIQFIKQWLISKLLFGNTYVLKERNDARGIVTGLYVLDPRLVNALVATNGEVFYQLNVDYISGLGQSRPGVPASQIIHDRTPTLFHPLLGVSPIYACGASTTQGIRIQANSAAFFENMSRPSGALTTPNHIPDDTADRLKRDFEERFSGPKLGRLLVLGDALTYVPMTVNAVDAQLIEQLKWTVEDVARCFHVPLHMIGSGPNPTFQNIGTLTQLYYSQTLQTYIEDIELCLTEGLELPAKYTIELDLDALLRLDQMGRYEAYSRGIGAAFMSPNEARLKENLAPKAGGDELYMQQQNYSLAALAKRDQGDPFAKPQDKPFDPFASSGDAGLTPVETGGAPGASSSSTRAIVAQDAKRLYLDAVDLVEACS